MPLKLGVVFPVALAGMAVAGTALAEPVKIGVQPWLGYGPLWIAAEKGFFEKHGVEAELVNFTWDQDMSAALASGNLQVESAATNTLISLINQGVDVKGFMIMDASYEADAILAPADVASVADLTGKQIAYERGATSDLLLNYALREAGMSIDDVTPVQMAASDAGLALVADRVDIAVTYEPYISAALGTGSDVKVLYTAAEAPGLISDMLIAETSFIENNADAVRGIIRAWDDAVTFFRENPDEGGRIIADAVGSPMDEFKVAMEGVRLYDLSENVEALDGDFQSAFTTIATIMHETNPADVPTIPEAADAIVTDPVMSLAN